MPFTEVWAHADSYPRAMPFHACDEHIGRLRNSNDMSCMMNPLDYINVSKVSGGTSMLAENETLQEDIAKEKLKRHATVDEPNGSREKRGAYDFLINNVGYDGSNMQASPQLKTNAAKKRIAANTVEADVDCKRFCMENKGDEMEIDGQSQHTCQVQTVFQPENHINITLASASTVGIVPTQDHSFHCGSGHDFHSWQNESQKSIVNNNSTISKNSFLWNHSNSIDDDDVEFMYQATHGGNFMHHQSHLLGDDL